MKLMKVIAILLANAWPWIRSIVMLDDAPTCSTAKFEIERAVDYDIKPINSRVWRQQ